MSALTERRGVVTERSPAIVLLAELRNFTRMSEMLEPQKVLDLASGFFALVADAVEASGGEVFGVRNDTLTAAFRRGAPPEQGRQAVAAAQRIQREFGAIAESWQREYGLMTAVAMGLHLGDTVFGMAGPDGAAQFVAFGDCVSIAERLVHRARAGEFVLSAAVMDALEGSKAELGAAELPPLQLARRESIPIYGVLLDTRLDFT
ncbi:MAG TPA: adenylate/guanylate cyclase domain-containing protein [Burkholderiales bacterium]|nr:adenylate/guanylate cyclase domain-containing protein [Burkholderiales bacterium]